MTVVIRKRAKNTLTQVADWISSQYFEDTGVRWLDEFNQSIKSLAKSHVKYAICKDESLAKYSYRCFTYKHKWVIAYKATSTNLTVYRVILGSRLK